MPFSDSRAAQHKGLYEGGQRGSQSRVTKPCNPSLSGRVKRRLAGLVSGLPGPRLVRPRGRLRRSKSRLCGGRIIGPS